MMTVFCFFLPVLVAVRFNVVGELNLAEPIVMGIAAFKGLTVWRRYRRWPLFRRVVALAAIWLVALVFSDVYRGTASEDYLRGWSRIVILICSYLACGSLIGTSIKRAVAMTAGAMAQPIVNYFIYHPDLPLYKFIFGFAVSFAAFYIACIMKGHRRIWMLGIPAAAGVLALAFNCRSLAGITLCAVAYYSLVSMGFLADSKGWKRRLMFAAFWLLMSASIINIYSRLAEAGKLSEEAQDKYEEQVNKKGEFSLLSGRSEVLYSIPKILQSPLIGWGSWAKDIGYVGQRAEELGLDPTRAVADTGGLIPTHSHLFGAWLEAGLFGSLLWFYVLYLIGRLFLSGRFSIVLRYSGVFIFVIILFAWDIVFSPFGGERRFGNGLYLWLITIFLSMERVPRPPRQIVRPQGPVRIQTKVSGGSFE